jgi:CRISPR-associated exonuclease Cas4
VRRGKILYQNRSLEVLFDDALRSRLLDAMAELKSAEVMSDVPRSHHSPARCRGCGFRQDCRDSLASA